MTDGTHNGWRIQDRTLNPEPENRVGQGVRQPTLVSPSPECEWLTYAEAGEMVKLSRVTLWKLVSAGEVEAARVGRAVRLNRRNLTDYMKRSANGSTVNVRDYLSPIGDGNERQRQSLVEDVLFEGADKATFDSPDRGLVRRVEVLFQSDISHQSSDYRAVVEVLRDPPYWLRDSYLARCRRGTLSLHALSAAVAAALGRSPHAWAERLRPVVERVLKKQEEATDVNDYSQPRGEHAKVRRGEGGRCR